MNYLREKVFELMHIHWRRDLEIHPRNSSLTIVNLESYYICRTIIEIPFVRFKIVGTNFSIKLGNPFENKEI
jgi:hypothetical protein